MIRILVSPSVGFILQSLRSGMPSLSRPGNKVGKGGGKEGLYESLAGVWNSLSYFLLLH